LVHFAAKTSMNQVLIDNSILAAACIIAIFIVRFSSDRKTGAVGAFFLLFSPLVVFLNMWAHTVAVLIVNYKRYIAGSFQFGFYFYSLLLLGVVFIIVSGINIHLSRKRIKGDLSPVPSIHWLNLATGMLFLPVVFINPIASLPIMASIASSLALKSMRSFHGNLIYDKHNTIHRKVPLATAATVTLNENQ
jgi:hypothetical protein